MRILWFTDTPSLAVSKVGMKEYSYGWISSLEEQISLNGNIQLGIAFAASNKNKFSSHKTQYYTFSRRTWRIKVFFKRWFNLIESKSEIDDYLEIIKDFKPDLIHIFGSERSFGLIIQYTKVPVILQIQGNLSSVIRKWFLSINPIDVIRYSPFKILILGYDFLHSYLLFKKKAIRERVILEKCKYIIGRTDWDRRIMKIHAPNSAYFHCDEIIRSAFYNYKWEVNQTKSNTLISIIKPVTYKGIETILETSNLLNKIGLSDFKWKIVGVKETDYIVRIVQKKYRLNFSNNNIFFLGSLDENLLIKELLSSSCYVHPSHIENSPNSVCEAMVLGMPVIATFAGGTGSMIDNNVEGILIQDGDPYCLAGAIIEILENPELAKSLGRNATNKAKLRHNPIEISNKQVIIYNEILKIEMNSKIK